MPLLAGSLVYATGLSGCRYVGAIVRADPRFVDAAHGDYRRRVSRSSASIVASPAVDFAPASGSDGNTTTQDPSECLCPNDVVDATQRNGTRDLGAFESQPIERLFVDGFGDPLLIAD